MAGGSVDLLLITHNRAAYVEKTLRRLFCREDDIRVYWWDNASTDRTPELVASWPDPRIVDRFMSPENVLQTPPTLWFLERSRADLVGKVDDDTLVPPGWTGQLSEVIRADERAGMIGCWTYWPEDFERNRRAALRKVVTLGGHRVLQDFSIGGTAFLVRRSVALRYVLRNGSGRGFPINRSGMTFDGLISGWYFPLLWAEHMDDPRSAHCLMGRMEIHKGDLALTARTRGLVSPAQYLAWIQRDVDRKLNCSLRRQCFDHRFYHSTPRRLLRRLRRRVVLRLGRRNPIPSRI